MKIAGVHRLELRAVDGDQGRPEQAKLAAQHHELSTRRLDRRAVLAAEVGDGLVIRRQPPRQPHQLDVALRLPLQPAARLHLVQIAVDVQLQQRGGMIGGATRRGRRYAFEAKPSQIQIIDENIDHPNRVVVSHIVIETFGKQRLLSAVCTLDEAAHFHLLMTSEGYPDLPDLTGFSHSLSQVQPLRS